MTLAQLATWTVAAVATAAVIVRPGRWPEAVWAVAGALVLVLGQLLPWQAAWQAVGKGLDVYLFLTGMMLVSELARREGLFDVLAARAVRHARGSPTRLFLLVYAIGVGVTVFMSNDATAVVLTPAVCAVAKKSGAKPLPYLLACALVANAASFVLPISNPANLVIFGDRMPALLIWIKAFALPSLAAVLVTWGVLRWLQRDALRGTIARDIAQPALSATGRLAAGGLVLVALALVVASAFEAPLGLVTLVTAGLVTALVTLRQPSSKLGSLGALLRGISWSVLALVAGLFVLVEGLVHTGVVGLLSEALQRAATAAPEGTAWGLGGLIALLCNVMNNLPAGLMAGSVLANLPSADASTLMRSAVTIGIDLGPNLSLTGSLATLLWLVAIRREGENVTAGQFLRIGVIAMPLALAAALGALWLQNWL